MTNGKVTVVARIRAREGQEARVRRELLALIPPTTAEKGCISYDLHQAAEDPSLFMFYENWLSRADLEDHLQKPHLLAWRAIAGELLEEPVDISLWQLLSD
jgi:quinol monooxygenase YgiN